MINASETYISDASFEYPHAFQQKDTMTSGRWQDSSMASSRYQRTAPYDYGLSHQPYFPAQFYTPQGIPRLIESHSADAYPRPYSLLNETRGIVFQPPSCHSTVSSSTHEIQHGAPPTELTKEDSRLIRLLRSHPEHEQLCAHLTTILTSAWRRNNEEEPEGVFLQFITKVSQHQFQCIFCSQEHTRADRAVAHCRKHINHRPFACSGGYCRDNPGGCGARFFTRECLTAHRKQERVVCEHCNTEVEKKNLKRHSLTQRCTRRQ